MAGYASVLEEEWAASAAHLSELARLCDSNGDELAELKGDNARRMEVLRELLQSQEVY